MNVNEISLLIRMVKGLCPAQKFDEYTPDAWLLVLGAVRFEDAQTALPALGQRLAFIAPSDIHAEVKRIRAARHDAANIVYEPFGDETGREFLDRIGLVTRAAGDGRLEPRPIGRALEPGTEVPTVPAELEAVIEARRAARASLSVACPYCRAAAGQPCTIGKRRRSGGTFMHPARIESRGRTAA